MDSGLVMTAKHDKVWLRLAVTFILVIPGGVAAQAPAEKPSSENAASSGLPASKAAKKPDLTDPTRVSTVEAAREAKRAAAKKNAGHEAASSDVLEFRPATPDAGTARGTADASSKDSKKSVLKNVHGMVRGAVNPTNSGDPAVGASVGARSRSGKSHIYVETDRSRTGSPPR